MHESVTIGPMLCSILGTNRRRGTCTLSCVWYHMGHTDLSQEVKQQIAALILIPNNKITLVFQSIGSKTTGFYNTA